MCMPKKKRINITVDEKLVRKAKKKLEMFGGKMSTLFNAYLSDFVDSMDEKVGGRHKEMEERIKDLEKKVKKLEK